MNYMSMWIICLTFRIHQDCVRDLSSPILENGQLMYTPPRVIIRTKYVLHVSFYTCTSCVILYNVLTKNVTAINVRYGCVNLFYMYSIDFVADYCSLSLNKNTTPFVLYIFV